MKSSYGYDGEGTIQYQDAGDCGFYLQERSDSIKVFDNGTTKINWSFNVVTEKDQVKIGESNSTDKIHIEPLSQTLPIISDKNGWYISLTVISIGSVGNIVRLLWKRFSKK